MAKGGRHDSYDGVKISIYSDRLTQDVRIRPKHGVPQTIADDRSFRKSFASIAVVPDPTHRGPRMQQFEIARADRIGLDALRFLSSGNVGVDGPNRRELIEYASALLKIIEFGLRHAGICEVGSRYVFLHRHELFRL